MKLNLAFLPLGIMDFLNPIVYTLFFVQLTKGLKEKKTDEGLMKALRVGAIISLASGYIIATGKTLVGFGLFDFELPVPLFWATGVGFVLSGLSLLFIYKRKKFAEIAAWLKVLVLVVLLALTVAVVFVLDPAAGNSITQGVTAIGTFILYGTMIAFAARDKNKLALILAIVPILTTAGLIPYSASVDLTDPATHWVIEPTNIAGQVALWLSASCLFKHKK